MSCLHCRMSFASKKLFVKHSVKHKDPSFVCEHCARLFRRSDNLKRHIQEVHKVEETSPACICTQCGKQFARKMHLVNHIKAVHGDGRRRLLLRYNAKVKRRRRWGCWECHISFKRIYDFKIHKLKKHGGHPGLAVSSSGENAFLVQQTQGEGQGDVLSCKNCEFTTYSRRDLHKHKMENHKGELIFDCDKCDRRFKTMAGCAQHRRKVHCGRLFVCEGLGGCGKEFKTQGNLRRHRVTCGKPRQVKSFELASRWSQARRANKTAEQFISSLGSMGEKERARTVIAMAKKCPNMFDKLASNPLTIKDITEVCVNLIFHITFHLLFFILCFLFCFLILFLP